MHSAPEAHRFRSLQSYHGDDRDYNKKRLPNRESHKMFLYGVLFRFRFFLIVQSIILHSKTIYTVKDILFCYDYCILLPNSHNTSYIKLASVRRRIVGENFLRFHSLSQPSTAHSFMFRFVLFETISFVFCCNYFTMILKHNCDLKARAHDPSF